MQPDSFSLYFKLKNGPHVLMFAAIATVVLAILAYKGVTDDSITPEQLIKGVIGAFVIADLAFTLIYILPYFAYRKFVRSGSMLAEQWIAFVQRRSKDFLEGKRHVSISISLKPTATAKPEHREAIGEWLNDVQTRFLVAQRQVGKR